MAAPTVLWDTPVEARYLRYGTALAAVAALAAAALALFAWEALRRRVAVGRGIAALLLAVPLAGAAGLAATVAAVGQGHPAWDEAGSALLRQVGAGVPLPLLQGLALLGSFPVLLAALLGLFAWMLRRARWLEAYAVLAAGGGLAGILVSLKLLLPRLPPAPQPFFAGATAFPNDSAALAPAFLVILLFLRRRLQPGRTPRAAWMAATLLCALAALAPVLLGQAWLSDAVAGVLLAALWLPVSLTGLLLAEDRPLLRGLLDRADAVAQRLFAKPVPWLLAAVAVGIALRVAGAWWTPLGVDAYAYAVMGNQALRTGSFLMPWGDVHTYLTAPVPSHHYPPLYPLYLAGAYSLLGFSRAATHAASIASGLAALLVTWLCTRDLYGPRKALVATAIVALSPVYVLASGQGYSENLVLLLFVATLWAILRSLEHPWFILPAGILAGLGYLTKSSMGYFFVVAGLGGLAWRLHWRGWRVLRDPAYLSGIAAFGALAAAWAVRNLTLFGSWETSRHISEAYRHALAHPLQWGFLTLVTFVFYATVGYLVLLALLPWLPRLARTPRLGSEHDSGLWLALGLPLLLTSAIDAALWLQERHFFVANLRYIGFVTVPAAWLLLRHLDPRTRSVRLAAVGTFALLLAAALLAGKPSASSIQPIADDLGARLRPGDSVGFVDTNVHGAYRFYFQLTQDGTRAVPVRIACAADPLCPPDAPRPGSLDTTWVVMAGDGGALLPPGYAPVPGSPAQYDPRFPGSLSLWQRT